MAMENKVLTGLTVVIFSVYMRTLSPNIAGGDSGELVAEGCILGTAHPPGYPLLTMIVYLLKEFVPLSLEDYPVAYRINALSAAFTALAAGIIGKTVLLLSPKNHSNVAGAIFAAGMFAFSPLIWQYAVTAEVFPLNTLLASVIVYLTVAFSQTGSLTVSHVGALMCGLALCNQHTIILFEVPLILWMLFLLRNKMLENKLYIASHVGLTLFGLSAYSYLPVVATLTPKAGSWGYLASLTGFLHHFLRKDYGTFQLFSGNSGQQTAGLMERTVAYFYDVLVTQGMGVVLPFALMFTYFVFVEYVSPFFAGKKTLLARRNVAMQAKNKGKKKTAVAVESVSSGSKIGDEKSSSVIDLTEGRYIPVVLIATLSFYFLVFHSLSNLPLDNPLLYGVHQRFWMQPNVILFLMAGLGFNTVMGKVLSSSTISPVSSVKSISYLFILISVLLCTIQVKMWYSHSDQSEAFYFRDYAKALVDPLPPSSILIINYDMQWTSVRYMQSCENLRPDVTVINLSMMTYEWFQHQRTLFPANITFPGLFHSQEGSAAVRSKIGFTFSQFVAANPNHSIYFSGKMSFRDSTFDKLFDHEPFGLVSKITPMNKLPTATKYSASLEKSWLVVADKVLKNLPGEEKYSEETWEWTIARDMKDRLVDTSSFFLQLAIAEAKKDPTSLVESIYWLESTLLYEGGLTNSSASSSLLKNIGLAHVNLIQNKLIPQNTPLPAKPFGDVLGTLRDINWPTTSSWKIWSTERFVATWGEFLRRPDAVNDAQYKTIKQMYSVATEGKSSKKTKHND